LAFRWALGANRDSVPARTLVSILITQVEDKQIYLIL